MELITSRSESNETVRQWIRELTDYTPQKIDEVLERRKDQHGAVRVQYSQAP